MYFSQSLLISVLGYEAAKREMEARSVALWRNIEGRVAEFADYCDKKYAKPQKCTGDIMCQSEGVRHKVDCQGKTEPFIVYARGLGSIE